MPDLTDVKQAYLEFKKYARKLRNICQKQDRPLRYIVVVEFQDKNSRGAVHFHMIADIPNIPVTKEIANEWKREGKLPQDYKEKLNHSDLWGNGSVHVQAIRESFKQGKPEIGIAEIGTADIGEYVAGYMVKDFGDPRLQGNKAYSPSKGLLKPVVLYDEEAVRAVQDLNKENVVREGSYPDTYHHAPVRYTKYNAMKK